jgi:hypothetical protein
LGFLEWLDKSVNKLREDHSILSRKRIDIVHRGYPQTTRTYAVNISGSARVSIISEIPGGIFAPQAKTQWIPNVQVKTYFEERPNESVIDICERAYKDMERLVQDAEEEVWKTRI